MKKSEQQPNRYKKGYTSNLVHAYQTYHHALDGPLAKTDRKNLTERGIKPPSQKQYKLRLLLSTAIEYAFLELDDCLKLAEIQDKKKERIRQIKLRYSDDKELAKTDPHLILDKREQKTLTARHEAILEFCKALKEIEQLFYPNWSK